MKKYHIGRRGKPNPCAASEKACPLGHGTPHFSSIQEANSHIESTYNEQYNILSSLSEWNPDNAKKELDKVISQTIANIDNDNYATSVRQVQEIATKYNTLPETLIGKYKEFTQSKEYVDSIHSGDDDKYRKMRNLSLHLVKPASDALNKKADFYPDGINGDEHYYNSGGKVIEYMPEKGTKEWYKRQKDTLTPDEAAIIYQYKHGKPNDEIKDKYNAIVKDKSTPYTDEDFEKMENEHKNNIYLDTDEVLAPIIAHEYSKKLEGKDGFIKQDYRAVEHSEHKYLKSHIDGLVVDREELEAEEIEQGAYTGVLIATSSDEKWGKHVPPHEVMKAMYITDIAGHDQAIIVNKEMGIFNKEYKLDLDYKISDYHDLDTKQEEHLNYSMLKNELTIFMENCQHTREQESITRKEPNDQELIDGILKSSDFTLYDPKIGL